MLNISAQISALTTVIDSYDRMMKGAPAKTQKDCMNQVEVLLGQLKDEFQRVKR